MRLLLKQYLASLRERDELDIILPDILTEAGFTVISRPKRGTAQYGVDAVAVGPNPATGVKSLYLLSIKSGNLTRSNWDDGRQALRPSLVDILDYYIPKLVPVRLKDMPIVVALCFGGDVQEDVRPRVSAFIDKNTEPGKIEFDEWNGDRIVDMIATGLLRENLFPASHQALFRKAVAMVDEPDACVAYFLDLTRSLATVLPTGAAGTLRVARQIYLACWTIYAWSRDAGNLEAAYQVSANATLALWDLWSRQSRRKKDDQLMGEVVAKSIALHLSIATAFIEQHIAPYCHVPDGLGAAVPSSASVDINLKLFEMLGRVALHGLWLIRAEADAIGSGEEVPALGVELEKTHALLRRMIAYNQVLSTPLRDDHAIEIGLGVLFLLHCRDRAGVVAWLGEVIGASIFSHRSHGPYPCIFREYSELAMHPRSARGYREQATAGSVLYPSLALWASMLGDEDLFASIAAFHADEMTHSTWQFWVPDEASEKHIYLGTEPHGASVNGLNTSLGVATFGAHVASEVKATPELVELSAIRSGYWPIVLMACRVHRLPVPPHFCFLDPFASAKAS